MGKFFIKKQNGNQWLLKEVRHVPKLKKNLISTRKLGCEGCETTIAEKTWKVTKGALVIEKGEKVGPLYLCNIISHSVNSFTSIGAYTTLWNHRLGHMHEKWMQIPHLKILVLGLTRTRVKKVKRNTCDNKKI